jgi:hypothetical protein
VEVTVLRSDTRKLRLMASELRKTSPAILKATQAVLRAEGQKIAERSREKSSWSTKIPEQITVRVSGVNKVTISANSSEAAALEHGGNEGTFRHPLNWPNQRKGGGSWVDQDARPFLHPVAYEELDTTLIAVRDAVLGEVEKAIDI